MGEFIIAVIAAFVFFMVVLPAVGILAGIFLRAGLPYAAGFWVCYVTVWLLTGGQVNWAMTAMLSAVWVGAVWLARRMYQAQKEVRFSWHEGHYTGALLSMLLFVPLWRAPQPELEPALECQAEG